MKNIRKSLMVLMLAAIPMVSFAKDSGSKPEMINLNGVTKENRTGIEKLAKENGATKASLDQKSGTLKVYGHEFKKDQFASKVSTQFPGVSVK